MRNTGHAYRRLIACAALVLLALAGCSRIGLVYNRLDTLVHFQIGRLVDLNQSQRAAFDSRFDQLWDWHRRSQLPLYARELRELAAAAAAPIGVDQLRRYSEQTRRHVDLATQESLRVAAAPTLAALDDEQVHELLAAVEKRAGKDAAKQRKLDDAQWRKRRINEAVDRLDDWAGAVTTAQRERIALWAAAQQRPAPDPQAERRREFAELMKTRHQPGFEQRLQRYTFEPFQGEAEAANRPETEASLQLLADLSASLTPEQRRYLQRKFTDMAAQLDVLVADRSTPAGSAPAALELGDSGF